MSNEGIHEFVKTTAEYKKANGDPVEQLRLLTCGFARWKAYIFWENSDNDKYGQLKQGAVNAFARGQDDFPKNLEQARNILASHKFEQAYYDKQKKREENNKKNASDTNKKQESNKSQQKQVANASAGQQHAQSSNGLMICFKCGGTGHTTKSCKANIPQGEWACLLYTSPSPRDLSTSRMPSSA